ncbi:hypothetical protein WN944_009331 [Citrus x changshan-huyou]|uniref:Uncharacterized protein n=1 Tax=Citrus x changshan-huyou TaxID=2935761 RepID=A0AAP0MV08_9ROSI
MREEKVAANPSKDSLSNVAGSYWMEVDCCFSSGADGEWNREKCVRVLMNDQPCHYHDYGHRRHEEH